MSSERIKVEKTIKNCGNGWCSRCEAGEGHRLKYVYNSIVDMSTLTLDDNELVAPDNVIDLLAQMIIDGNEGAIK